jgi:hypothetical protein
MELRLSPSKESLFDAILLDHGSRASKQCPDLLASGIRQRAANRRFLIPPSLRDTIKVTLRAAGQSSA